VFLLAAASSSRIHLISSQISLGSPQRVQNVSISINLLSFSGLSSFLLFFCISVGLCGQWAAILAVGPHFSPYYGVGRGSHAGRHFLLAGWPAPVGYSHRSLVFSAGFLQLFLFFRLLLTTPLSPRPSLDWMT